MEIEWNNKKNRTNLLKHSVDFCYAAFIFNNEDRLIEEDQRLDYGEERYITIGQIDGAIYTVIYTLLQRSYRIVSARGASRHERKTYQNQIDQKE